MTKRITFLIGILCFFMTGIVFADTYDPKYCLYVSSPNTDGIVVIKGNPVDISRATILEQYKPDKFKHKDVMGNKFLKPISRTDTELRYQLNMASAKKGQRAYQLHFNVDGDLWLLLPNPKVVVGENTKLDHSDPNSDSLTGGAFFVYTPAIP